MKRITYSLITCCVTMMMQAQIAGHDWYNGTLQYSAEKIAGGKILMNAMDEGEEHEFLLNPVAGKAETYRITDSENHYVNEYDGMTAKYMKKEGLDVIGFYNSKNQLESVMEKVEDNREYYESMTVARWKQQLKGTYSFPEGGGDLIWDDKNLTVGGVIVPYDVVLFNGRVTGYIRVEGSGTILEGLWEVIPTLKGIHLYEINEKGDFLYEWERTSVEYALVEINSQVGRFDYATKNLLNPQFFRHYKKSTLRIMRNAIMARNGYRFQSKDLQDYFGKEPWYKPAASNDNIKLSFIEQLNVDLIKAEEENPEHEAYVKEPNE